MIDPGTVYNNVISQEDWMPTLLHAAGVPGIREQLKEGTTANGKEWRVHLDGYDFLPFFKGEVEEPPRDEIVYWIRSNTLLTALDRTDGVHTGFSIASVFFLLFLLYTVRISGEVTAQSHRAAESVAVALVGLWAAAAWWWARRHNLVRQGLPLKDLVGVQLEAFTEPVAALITLPFAFVGELAWNLSWSVIIPVTAILRRWARRAA